jgi:hypothetical protein
MPHQTLPIVRDGLGLEVMIGLCGQDTLNLLTAGQPVPAPVQARAWIDTASNVTCVPARHLSRFQLPLFATQSVQTTAGPIVANFYEVSLSILRPGGAGHLLTLEHLVVQELAPFLPDVDVLIGRDILADYLLISDGPGRQFTLSV